MLAAGGNIEKRVGRIRVNCVSIQVLNSHRLRKTLCVLYLILIKYLQSQLIVFPDFFPGIQFTGLSYPKASLER